MVATNRANLQPLPTSSTPAAIPRNVSRRRPAKGKSRRPAAPRFRVMLTMAAGMTARQLLTAVVLHRRGCRPILIEISPQTSAYESADAIRRSPFGWRATLWTVTVAREPMPAKAKGDVFLRVSPNLDVWPDLAAAVIADGTRAPLIDFLQPSGAVKRSCRSLTRYSDNRATRAVAVPVVVLPPL